MNFACNSTFYLKVASLNVCGLKRRSEYPDFCDYVRQFDILCFSETKTDNTDVISIKGYECFMQPRKQKYQRKSGGICLLVKDEYSKYIKVVETSSDYIFWARISGKFVNLNEDVLLGIMYVPPNQSKYLNEDEFMTLEMEVTSMCSQYSYVILTGDINARTAELRDFTEMDSFLADYFDFESETLEFFDQQAKLRLAGIPLQRKSKDKKTNNNGFRLLEICKNNNLLIANGRIGKDKNIGSLTFRNTSLIDYTICSVNTLEMVHDFEVIELDPLFSDGHSLLSVILKLPYGNRESSASSLKYPNYSRPKWDNRKTENFIRNIDTLSINSLIEELNTQEVNKVNINLQTDKIANIMLAAANRSFASNRKYIRNTNDKPWYGSDCKRARKDYLNAKSLYRTNRTSSNKASMVSLSKIYKQTMNKYMAKYRNDKQHNLRNMQRNNPKEYWQYLNSLHKKKTKQLPTLDSFFSFYEELNSDDKNDNQSFPLDDFCLEDDDVILNSKIQEDEILHCINSLKNGKSAGDDRILNEYLKSTKTIFLPVYKKLFNNILNTGIIPESWLNGIIKPIFKNKGSPLDTGNYRPITILSCLGKLFTSILNSRLTKFLDENILLNENQAGFRKDYSTSDHIFVLNSLIEIMKFEKKKLFCAFIDFSQAFDNVWRIGLWRKLLSNSVKGKFFRVIYNMYSNIKSCVSANNEKSSFFVSKCGVR